MTHRSVVLFPAPLRPTSVMSSPSFTSKLTSRSACACPYHAVRFCTSSIDLSEIRGDDRGIVPHLLVAAVGDHAALLHHDYAIGKLRDDAHVVLDEADGAAGVEVANE